MKSPGSYLDIPLPLNLYTTVFFGLGSFLVVASVVFWMCSGVTSDVRWRCRNCRCGCPVGVKRWPLICWAGIVFRPAQAGTPLAGATAGSDSQAGCNHFCWLSNVHELPFFFFFLWERGSGGASALPCVTPPTALAGSGWTRAPHAPWVLYAPGIRSQLPL